MTPVESAQTSILRRLLRTAERTVVGKTHGFASIRDPAEFARRVPLCSYSDIEPYIERAKGGEHDVLWPGRVGRFAVSSGTTGKGKHLPVTDQRLQSDLRFMRRVSARIIRDYPRPSLFFGRHAALSGSVEQVGGLQMGEISGMLACASPWWVRGLHCLCPARAAAMPWEDRYQTLVQKAMTSDIRVISGVPSWLLLFFQEIAKRRSRPISEVWPNLKLVVTGGVALSGYLQALKAQLGPLPARFLENYGASEGYYAFGWQTDGNMGLQYDHNIYYELVPFHPSIGVYPTKARPVPLWKAEPGVPYNLVVTTDAGLWRYVTNDVVTFDAVSPPRLRVTGRANEMTDTFGEALTAAEAREAFNEAWSGPPPDALHVTSGWDESSGLPRHTWLVAYQTHPVSDLFHHAEISQSRLDAEVRRLNRHYEIRRATGALLPPRITLLDGPSYMALLRHLPKSQSKLGMFLEG